MRSPQRQRHLVGSAVVSLVALALLSSGCEGESSGPASTGPEETAPQVRDRERTEDRSDTQRVFAAQMPRTRPDFVRIAAGVDPAHPSDPWPGELLASSAEVVLGAFVRHLALGGAPGELRGLLTRDVHGSVASATTAPPAPTGPIELVGEDLLAGLGAVFRLTGVTDGDIVIEVDVVAVDAPALGEVTAGASPKVGHTTVRILVGTRPEMQARGPREQIIVMCVIEWRLARRARMSAIDVTSSRRTRLEPPFRDVTLDVLVGGGVLGALSLGALEAGGRTDRLVSVSDIQIAMHGAAVGDLDGDGWEDLVVGRAAGQPNLVFINDGGLLREDSAGRGLDLLDDTGGMLIVDLDGDGARDVVMGVGPDVMIAWNDGTGRFSSPQVLSIAGGDRVYSLCVADVDGDGDLDLYDTRYFKSGGYGAQAPTPYHDATNGAPNVFWRNLLVDAEAPRARAFRDDTAAIGLAVDNDRFSLVAVFDDLDEDGDLDLYVANDFGRNNLYLWDGGRFHPAEQSAGLVDKAAGMGISIADVDLDGRIDVIVSNMHSAAGMRVTREPRFQPHFSGQERAEFMRHARGNTLFRGTAPGVFEDVTETTGAAPGGWAWGSRFVDWDRDGLVDIIVPNGFLSGRKGPDLQSFFWRRVVGASPVSSSAPPESLDRYLGAWSVISYLSQYERQDWNARERTFGYANRGAFRFDDVTLASGLGFADDGRALLTCDIDQDGRVDLIFRNRTAPILRVLQGTVTRGNWASFRLVDDAPNGDAIGALVTITAGDVPRRARITAGDGFLGGSSLEAFFGLGDAGAVDVITVTWADGTREDFSPAADAGSAVVGGAWRLSRGSGVLELRHRGRDSRPGLAATPRPSIPSAEPGPPRARVPLLAEFPLGAFRLPSFDGEAERVDALAGRGGTALILWAITDARSVAALAELGRSERALIDAGVHVHALSLDGVRESRSAQDLASSWGLRSSGGRADRATRTIVELILGRTLAPFDDLPLPLTMLFDSDGDLCCLHVGALDAELVAADAVRLAERADSSSTLVLTGGRWASDAPRRALGDLPDKLATRGFDELADHLRAASGR